MFLIHLMMTGYPKIDSAINTIKEGDSSPIFRKPVRSREI